MSRPLGARISLAGGHAASPSAHGHAVPHARLVPVLRAARRRAADAGWSTRIACVAASPSSPASGSAYGRSLPSTRTSIPSTRTSASSALGAVRRRVDEDVRVDVRPVPPRATCRSWCTGASPAPAANTQPQRREQRAAADGVPAPPGGLELRGVPDDRRPPRRQPTGQRAGQPGPGCTRTGLPASLRDPQDRRRALPARPARAGRWPAPARRRSRRAAAPASRRGPGRPWAPTPRRGSARAASRAPSCQARAARRPPARAGSRSRAARRGDAGQADPLLVVRRDAPLHVVVRRVDLVGRLAARVQRPAPQVRRARAARSRSTSGVGPQVLVHVDRFC